MNILSNILHEAELHERRPRKTPLLKDVQLKARLKFVSEHVDKDNIFWRQVLWLDETKIIILSELKYVWRKKVDGSRPRNTIPTVTHGGGSTMFYG